MNSTPLVARVETIALAGLVALGTWLRFHGLGSGLWFDEIVTLLESVRHPLGQIVTHFPSNNDHPLYSVLGRLSILGFGDEPWALRLPSALFGIATIPMLYFAGTAVTTRLEAGAAAAILTVSYHHIWFSQNARGYTMLLFFALLATRSLVRWLDTGRLAFLYVYAVSIAIGSYTHLTMVLVCLSHAIACALDWMLGGERSSVRGAWRQIAATFAGAGVLTLLLYAPMLLDVSVFFTTRTASQNEVATPAWAMLAAVSGLRIGFGTLWAVALGGMVFLAGIWSYATTRAAVALLFLLPLPVTLLSALVLQRPIFPRFFFFALGFMLLVAVRGAMSAGVQLARVGPVWLSPRRTGAAAVVLVTLAAVALSLRSLPYGYRYPKQNYADAVSFVDANRRGADAVAVVGETGATPVLKYLGRSWQRIDRAGQLRELRDRGHQVWVIDTFPAYIQAGQPELWHSLQSDCIVAGEFEGTVAGGTVHVRRCR